MTNNIHDGKIVNWAGYGEKIPVKCSICGAVFNTKNIGQIGDRSLFHGYQGQESEQARQCDAAGHSITALEPDESLYDQINYADVI